MLHYGKKLSGRKSNGPKEKFKPNSSQGKKKISEPQTDEVRFEKSLKETPHSASNKKSQAKAPFRQPVPEYQDLSLEAVYYDPEDELVIDPENIKHYLQNSWTFWYLENDKSKSWEDMQIEISTVNTVEDFWILYSHFKPPSQLRVGCDYSLFKKGIRPMWEDPANKDGGRWVLTLFKNCREDLDNIWLDVMLCLIGENLRNSNEVCGAVVSIRGKNNKISLWTSNGINKAAILEIGFRLRDALCLGQKNLKYQFHMDLMNSNKSIVQSAYIL